MINNSANNSGNVYGVGQGNEPSQTTATLSQMLAWKIVQHSNGPWNGLGNLRVVSRACCDNTSLIGKYVKSIWHVIHLTLERKRLSLKLFW